MLKTLKGKVGDFVRGFHGLYQNKFDKYLMLPEGLAEISLGYSNEDREIFAYRFGADAKIKILFMGGIHGNEVGTIKLMYKLINYLHGKRFLGVEIYVLPCLNPDGLAEALESPDYFSGGRYGRFNSNKVDLNRNFKTSSFEPENHWFFGDKNVSVYCGESGFSEPESKLLANFVKDHGISILYSFHSRGKEIMGSRDDLAQKLTLDFVEKTGYKYVPEESWRKMGQTGTIKEWCEENGVSYIEIESATRFGSDWKNQKSAIIGAIKYHYG
ncbi:MAG: M14 family zinc carboxypeptidase [bacterium]|nr:M14 family zinc carboxypeptidase [bacterium]